MLTREDLKQIGEVVDQKLDEKLDKKFIEFEAKIVPEIVRQVGDKVVQEVGEMIEQNVLPQFDRLERTLASKDDLDRAIGKVNGKITVLTDVLHANGTITGEQHGLVRLA